MINHDILRQAIAEYKRDFQTTWPNERYKWAATFHFQKHWDINAQNFADMFMQATSKAKNLLVSGYSYPRGMINNFARADQEATRQMFSTLFDETKDLKERILSFQAQAEAIKEARNDGTWNNLYQNTNYISVYLWLNNPKGYYIYKYKEYLAVAEKLESDYRPKANGSVDTMLEGFKMYDEIRNVILADTELRSMLDAVLDSDLDPDIELRTLTVDVGFYISRFFGEDLEKWEPDSYDPCITTQQWLSLLGDSSIFTQNDMEIMHRMLDIGGQASCSQLAARYGENYNFYNRGSVALAARVVKATNCPTCEGKDGKVKSWPVLYLGRPAEKNEPGNYIWKLRPELYKALQQVDLSSAPLYAVNLPVIWKISHGTESTGIPDDIKKVLETRHVVAVHGDTKAMANTKVPQGKAFLKQMKKGDFFYLCYGTTVKLFGQITSDEATLNDDIKNGWYERTYRTIKSAMSSAPYKAEQKWWTPNNNSTCIPVPDDERVLFESLILKPYFDMTLEQLPAHQLSTAAKKYGKEEFVQDVFMAPERYDVLAALLRRKKNIILQGAPGVGKTYTARRLAYSMIGSKDDTRIGFVQFHQNYSYEDFVIGWRPDGEGFKLTPGVFFNFCQKAESNPNQDYFFIIDEINRGNLSKIFGELLMLIEIDYRGKPLILGSDQRPFSVPENVYIIGMMNTADRSLAMIDYALRRRFSFFDMAPAFDSKQFEEYQNSLENDTFNDLIRAVADVNRLIRQDESLGPGFCIGHSYFCNMEKQEVTDEWMHSIVEFDLIPTLNEYWFDEPEKAKSCADLLNGVFHD